MNAFKKVNRVFEAAEQIPFDNSSKIVLLSDCHRGNGSWADDFSNNQNLFFAALTHYYNENYTYIEIGDGDELWKNRRMSDIIYEHSDAFWLMSQFYQKNRLYLIYGNHDMDKKNKKFVKNNLYHYYDERIKKYIPLFENIKVHEGLVLNHTSTGRKIFLVHGHQVDFLNNELWRLSRFLVRYLLRPIESVGLTDPTSTAKNYKKKDMVEKRLSEWIKKKNCMLIAGHTHRPMFPEIDEVQYFNDGSCVHPRCITAIEISQGCICLVKWNIKTKDDGVMYIGKSILAGPQTLKAFFGVGMMAYDK